MPENHPSERPSGRSELATFYADALADQEARGMSIADYAGELGVTAATLYAWRRRLRPAPARGGQRSDSLGLIEVKVSSCAPPQAAPEYVVRLTTGREIRIPEGFDAALLRRVIEVLESC